MVSAPADEKADVPFIRINAWQNKTVATDQAWIQVKSPTNTFEVKVSEQDGFAGSASNARKGQVWKAP